MKRIKATVTVVGGPREATELDCRGCRTTKKARTKRVTGGMSVVLPEESLYTLIE